MIFKIDLLANNHLVRKMFYFCIIKNQLCSLNYILWNVRLKKGY